jgi:hypothetical protein
MHMASLLSRLHSLHILSISPGPMQQAVTATFIQAKLCQRTILERTTCLIYCSDLENENGIMQKKSFIRKNLQ